MGKKILLADDSITIQKVIELTFSDEDFEVVTVGNGRLAIEKVLDVRPDVVLCDIIMPEKDGYEVCDFVKKNPALSRTPVLLLTGAFEPFDQERATRVGCDGFLAKPFEPQALIAKVKDLLRQVESRQAPVAAPAAAAPAPVRPPEPEPSPEATVWAAPAPAAPVWEPAPQTRPLWTPAPPVPVRHETSGVNFIPEDPFAEEGTGFAAPAATPPRDTIRIATPFADEAAPEVEAAAYPLEAPVQADELLPMSVDEEESLAEPIPWEEPTRAAAPEPLPAPAPASTERDLFLEEVFDEAADVAPLPAPAPRDVMQAPVPVPVYEPEPARVAEQPAPPPTAAVTDFTPVAREAGLESATVSAPEPEPEPELLPEPEPEAEERPAPELSSPSALVAEPTPEPAPPPPAAMAAEPAAGAAAIGPEEESFAGMAPAPEPQAAPAPSEAGAVAVPVDMVSQIAQRVVAQISEKVIREIAWEVIPDMAEALIKREIERLTAELHRS